MNKFTSKSQKIGKLGENVACRHLSKRGYAIVDRNYTKKCGEIDIVVVKDMITHFVEVKSISCDMAKIGEMAYRPEDQMNRLKSGRLRSVVREYLKEKEVEGWQVDLICIYLDLASKKGVIKTIEDIIL